VWKVWLPTDGFGYQLGDKDDFSSCVLLHLDIWFGFELLSAFSAMSGNGDHDPKSKLPIKEDSPHKIKSTNSKLHKTHIHTNRCENCNIEAQEYEKVRQYDYSKSS
jgi:hypothetical protein